jgi:hypothetical protein
MAKVLDSSSRRREERLADTGTGDAGEGDGVRKAEIRQRFGKR